ncbi:hypothetical protein [Campylobacter hyointestinalis]|uniref:hypothetical protein n=1 Tax=Campylobacter hyointestinalis TaxID=198 RepID=UPI000DCC1818|nr:hypothetical protein [Campylobacter hyointestinalis]RAZ50646.1 hypothetical protein CHL9004_01400 [Campylobacter hyointestinalis subsp. lawsonii]
MARAFCLLIALCVFVFGGEEFIFWAKYSSSNNLIKSQNIAISKAMVLSPAHRKTFLCEIDSFKFENESTLSFLKRNQEKLFECFDSSDILLNDTIKLNMNHIYSHTSVTLLPIRFIVDFKPLGAIISKINR